MTRVAIEIAPIEGGDDEKREISAEDWRDLSCDDLGRTRVCDTILIAEDGSRHVIPPREARWMRLGSRREVAPAAPVGSGSFDPMPGPLECGHGDGAHPNHWNYLSGAAERDGRVCRLGWPL